MPEAPVEQRFSPYADNGGTVIAICGKDFAIIASDTRLSLGYNILSREQSKLFQLTSKTIMGSTGCWCDALTFAKVIESRVKSYRYEHNREIPTTACGQLVSTMLYYKRFFPYYITNIIAGLDENGQGVCYHYDPVGSYEPLKYTAGGSSAPLIGPFLDNRCGFKNFPGIEPDTVDLTREEATRLIKDAFTAAGERDIYLGDSVDLKIITANGIESETHALRKD